ncbi:MULTISPECIES: hypothetical protein [unclassified Nitratiruptor]|uniref:hypothetical protein n=1 Tax=unclassified Nitratiruptor TaxID=2624044 RepID=UPI0019160C31|nr:MULTISPECIES: hypothetical protein [unclassified Nitratiruptor]BCD60034.1 hypothetical protein NitYY0810_C0797 [Nitratiruptor sp. YY08-10]BCD63956.1 hypothetical protein NitYY0814_C0795 [Nitratiruptor sp. YY08-14]BCD64475.1 hypothetical protein NitYY0814_C1322 [Nitratiruptor sp. YY08-14]
MKKVLAGLSALTLGAISSFAAITPPTPDYTDFEAVVGVVLGVSLVVMLAKRAKGFFR